MLAMGLFVTNMPGWRNGLRRGLKILDPKGFVGSTPTPGTKKFECILLAIDRKVMFMLYLLL